MADPADSQEAADQNSEQLLSGADSQQGKKFEGLDIRSVRCFGFKSPKQDGWKQIALQSVTAGWKYIDVKKLEQDLAANVDESYASIAEFTAEDVNTGIKWKAKFINDKQLWTLVIEDSPDAEVLLDDKVAFFTSELFLSFMKKALDYVISAKKTYDEIVSQHLEEGELLAVNEVKLSALLWYIDNKTFMSNFRLGEFIL